MRGNLKDVTEIGKGLYLMRGKEMEAEKMKYYYMGDDVMMM